MDRNEFISHVERKQRELRRFLTALCCGDGMLADDVAQDTLMKAYLACDGFDDPDRFDAWIFRIAYNTFLNAVRRRRPTVGVEAAGMMAAAERVDDAFRYQELYAALDALPERERTSILLYYMEGYSAKEVAAITETTEEAVRQHLSRGRRHLKKFLETEEKGEGSYGK